MTVYCITGCGQPAVHEHHVITRQELRRVARARGATRTYVELITDPRNLVPVCLACHTAHHARSRPFEFWTLPGSVFEFAREVLGAGPGYEYLIRFYRGDDERVAALLAEWVAAA